jgi:hypothetical protein
MNLLPSSIDAGKNIAKIQIVMEKEVDLKKSISRKDQNKNTRVEGFEILI